MILPGIEGFSRYKTAEKTKKSGCANDPSAPRMRDKMPYEIDIII